MPSSSLSALIVTAGILAGPHVAAQEYPARNVGDWTIAPSKDGQGCFLSRQYKGVGGTSLLLGVDKDESNHLSVLNDNWSIAPGDRMQLNFRLSKGGYLKHEVVGMASAGQRGFVTSFEAKFPDYFAASTALDISRGDVPVEHLDLTGSGAAVAELQRCVGFYRNNNTAETNKSDRSGAIPKDPFAPDTARPAKKQRSSQ
jgi:hypothetical protein